MTQFLYPSTLASSKNHGLFFFPIHCSFSTPAVVCVLFHPITRRQHGLSWVEFTIKESLGCKRTWSDGGIFFFPFSNRELITPSPCTLPSPTSSTTPRWCSPTASPRPSTRPRWPRPAPTAWPWAWSLAPPWPCQQVSRDPSLCSDKIPSPLDKIFPNAAVQGVHSSAAGSACCLLLLCRQKCSNLPQILI